MLWPALLTPMAFEPRQNVPLLARASEGVFDGGRRRRPGRRRSPGESFLPVAVARRAKGVPLALMPKKWGGRSRPRAPRRVSGGWRRAADAEVGSAAQVSSPRRRQRMMGARLRMNTPAPMSCPPAGPGDGSVL